jgi:hypothetical protein
LSPASGVYRLNQEGEKVMRKSWFMLIGIVFVLTPSVIQAEQKVLLGSGNFALKVGNLTFTDDLLQLIGTESNVFISFEGYGKILPNVYLGGEFGYATSDHGNASDHEKLEFEFTFFELNAKYAIDLSPYFVIDAGGGLSYNYAGDWEYAFEEEAAWLFGGQIFTDLTFKYHWFQLGINAKYQITQDFENTDIDLSNYRLGAQLGVLF